MAEHNEHEEKSTDLPKAPTVDPAVRRNAAGFIVVYTVARIVMVIVLSILIHLLAVAMDAPFPLVMTVLFALLITFPLSMLIFKGLRQKALNDIAAWDQQRKARKEWIHKELDERAATE